ncbi:MAG: GNAT family N-acetyltransferase [Armatimonadetes bacterium]|nr:GNAT family N-acetyltransferase [Armatimonadota bacterium]
MVDSESGPGRRSLLRRIAGRLRCEVQGWRWFRRLGRRLSPEVAITVRERPDTQMAQQAIFLQAFWRGRKVGQVWLFHRATGFPPEPEWWVFGLHVDESRRGLGIGEVLGREALRLAAERGARQVGALVHANNLPSITLCRKCGLTEDPASPFPAEWAAAHDVNQRYVLLRRTLGEEPEANALEP